MEKSECMGWIGKLFGHKFKSFLLESNSGSPEQIKESFVEDHEFLSKGVGPASVRLLLPSYREDILQELHSKKYIVLCKRCGLKENENI